MKNFIPICLLLSLSLNVLADDTIIVSQTISLDSEYSGYEEVLAVARDSIIMEPGFEFLSSTNSNFSTLLDPWELDTPVQDLDPGTQVEPTGTLDGSYVVGSINGHAGVNGSGAATYSIPIAVPAGTRGMSPQLSVSYNSQGGKGIMGRGWNLGGLSSISATGKVRYYDNESSSISDIDTACRVVWDGQRLFALNNAGLAADSFRTEIESHAKIERFGSESTMWFRIKTANGQTLEYGNTSDSRMSLDASTQWKWMLNKVYDRNGNTMVYSYQTDGDICEILLSKIEYGGLTSELINEVSFHYANKSDITYAYIHDDLIVNNKVLDSISMKSNDTYTGSYGFHFDSSMDETLLDEIVQYDKDNNRFNATTVEWNSPVLVEEPTVQTKIINSGDDFNQFTGDFTGDGIFDLVTVRQNILFNSSMYYLYPGTTSGLTSTPADSGLIPRSFTHDYWSAHALKFNNSSCSGTASSSFDEADFSYVFSGDFDGDGVEELMVKVLEWEVLSNYLPADLNDGFTPSYLDDFGGFYDIICNYTSEMISPDLMQLNYGIGHFIHLDKTISSGERIHTIRLGQSVLHEKQYSQFPDIDGRGYNSFPDNYSLVYYDPASDTAIAFCSVTGEQRWGYFDGDGKADFINPANTNFSVNLFDPSNKTYAVDQTISGYYLGTIDLNNDGISAWVALGDEGFETVTYETVWNECSSCDFTDDWDDFLIENGIFSNYLHYVDDYCDGDDDPACRSGFVHSGGTIDRSLGYELILDHMSGMGPEISFGYYSGTHSSEDPLLTRAIEADINADGKNDLLIFSNNRLKRIYYDFEPSYSNGDISYTWSTDTIDLILDDNIHLGDFNGDGITELIFPDSEKSLCFVTSGMPGKLVSSVSNGLGIESRYSYKPMTDTSVYTKESDAAFPVIDFAAPWYVVNSIASDNGVADSSFVEYEYEGAKIHLQGKGFLGFMKTTLENDQFNTSQVSTLSYDSTYFNTYPDSSVQEVGSTPVKGSTAYVSTENVSGLSFSVQTDSTINKDYLSGTTINTRYSYNSDGLVSEKETQVNSLATVTQNYTYTSAGWHFATLPEYVTTTYDRGGVTETDSTVFSYSSSTGNLTEKIDFYGTSMQVSTKINEYDSFGNPERTSITGKRGPNLSIDSILSSMTYDSDGRFMLSKSDPLNFKNCYVFDATTGNLESSTSENRTETTYEYGPFNRPESATHPSMTQEASNILWANGHDDAPTDALYYKWTSASGIAPILTFYDARGRELRSVTSGFGNETIYSDTDYDSKGRVFSKTIPYFSDGVKLSAYYYYDSFGRVSYAVSPDTSIITYDYDPLETTVTIRKDNDTLISRTKVNALGETMESEDNIGNVVHFLYYPDGKLKESYISAHSSMTTQFSYDEQGNRTSITDPDAGTINSTYDSFGQLVQQISAKIDTSSFEYDKIGRVTKSTDERGSLFYSYLSDTTEASFGMVDSICNADKSLTEFHTYDPDFGRMLTHSRTQSGKSFTNTYSYDWFGRPVARAYPSEFEVQYSYNSNGHLNKIMGEGYTLWSCSDVNALGQITDYSQGSLSTSLSYNPHGELNQVKTGAIMEMNYGFDNLGNLTSREDVLSSQKEVFQYDNLNRLTEIEYYKNSTHDSGGDLTTSYDNCGNITSKTGISSTINYGENAGPHALTSIETPESSYKPPPQSISYNCFNKVSSISDTLSGGVPLTLDFSYGLGNQRIKTVQTRNGSIERVKYFNGDYEEDSTAAGVKKYHYIQGGSGLTAIFVMNGSGNDTMYYALSDHLGSMTTIVNAASSEVENYSFTAWGMPRDASDWTQSYSGELFAGRGFTGHEHLKDFNLINMNGRIYDPILGRFISPDPFVQAPGYPNNYNRYSYALNNPLKFVDPSGFYIEENSRDKEYNESVKGYSISQGTVGRPTFSSLWNDYYASQSWSYNPTTGKYENSYTGKTKGAYGFNVMDHLPNLPTEYGVARSGLAQDLYAVMADPSVLVGIQEEYGRSHFITFNLETLDFTSLMGLTETSFSKNGGSLSGIVAATISGVLSAEDAYNNFLHNHNTYRTLKGRLKNIYKSNGRIRSERAAKFATSSKIIKWTGVAGTALMTGQATYNIVNDVYNNQPLSGWDIADGSAGLVGLTGVGLSAAGIISNPVGWGIGASVATYGWFSFWYEMGATYGPSNR